MTETFNNLHNGVQEKDRLEKAYNESLGSPACTRLLKKKQSSWNGFVKDKWGPKFEEVKGLPDYEGIFSTRPVLSIKGNPFVL